MEKERRIKMLSIIALVFAIAGMSLGFAAFSATLNISSSATVTPNSDDFKIKVYGLKESRSLTDIMNNFEESWLSDTIGMPNVCALTSATFIPAKITNGKNLVNISDIEVQYTNDTNETIEYYFMVKNEGKYDATLSYATYEQYFNDTYEKNCTSEEDTNKELVDQVCSEIRLYVTLATGELNALEEVLNSANKLAVDFTSGYTLKAGESVFMCVGIQNASVLPDGNMEIEFGDINLEFTTAPISN